MPVKDVGIGAALPGNPEVGDEFTAVDTQEKFTCFTTGEWVKTWPVEIPEPPPPPPEEMTVVLLGHGTTQCDNDIEYTVLGDQWFQDAAREFPLMSVMCGTWLTGSGVWIVQGDTHVPAEPGTIVYGWAERPDTPNLDFRVRQNTGRTIPVDWMILKFTMPQA